MTIDLFFDNLQNQFDKTLPFVIYRKPNKTIVKAFLQVDNTIHYVNDYSESGFVFAPFDSDQESVLIPLHASKTITIDSKSFEEIENPHLNYKVDEVTNRLEHINLIQKGIDAISDKNFEKVVLSRYETINLSNTNPISIFKRLLITYPNAFVYCWYHPKIGLWLGATPETLIQLESNRLKTMALAGTQKFKDSEEIQWKEKEIQEQKYVTEFIVDSLKDSVSSLKISDPKTVKAGRILHIKTEISGTLQSDLSSVLEKLHPTPAVCGLPKAVTKKFILKEENYNREFYTGFLGELNIQEKKSRNSKRKNVENNAYSFIKTTSELFVNLRCMQIKDSKALIYVGGGITKDSEPELEWQETINKTLTIKTVLD